MNRQTRVGVVFVGLAWWLAGCTSPPEPRDAWPVQQVLEKYSQAVTSLTFSPDGRNVATLESRSHPRGMRVSYAGKQFSQLGVWSVGDRRNISRIEVDGDLFELQFSPDGSEVLTCTIDELLRWNVTSNSLSRQPASAGWKTISPDGTTYAGRIGEDAEVLVVRKIGGDELGERLDAAGERIVPIAFSSDGNCLATLVGPLLKSPHRVLIWDWRHGTVQSQFPIKANSRWFFCFSPDGKLCAAASIDRETIEIWNPLTGMHVTTFDFDSDDIHGLTFSADSRLLVACGEAGSSKPQGGYACVWDLATHQVCARIRDDTTWGFTSVAFSPDGKRIAFGTGEGKIVFREVSTTVN